MSRLAAGVILLTLAVLMSGCGGGRQRPVFGRAISVEGTAEVLDTEGRWKSLRSGAAVHGGDSIRTDDESTLEIAFDDSCVVKLAESTSVRLYDTTDAEGQRAVAVFNGGGEIVSNLRGLDPQVRYEVRTPTAVANPEGTHFLVFFAPVPFVTHVKVLHGHVRVFNPLLPPAPPVILAPGFFTTVTFRVGPASPMPMNYGQFKKMQRVLGAQPYKFYSKKFGIKGNMKISAPIVAVGPPLPGMHGKMLLKGGPGGHGLKGGIKMNGPLPVPRIAAPKGGRPGFKAGAKGKGGKKGAGKKK